MKSMLVFTFLGVFCAISWAAPQGINDVTVLSSESENIGIGGYKFGYTLSDGTSRTEEATLNNAGTEEQTLTIRGTISYVAPDGKTYTTKFVADENGFRPEGEHIPK